jgi:dTDP-4-dehydrorhamnose reductase
MLGQDLTAYLEARHQVVPADLPAIDITDGGLFQRTLDSTKPDVVIHAAAITAVDECETRRELAFRVNGEGTRNVALACRKNRVPLLYISTDYVFDGEKETPYWEDDEPHPINVYGHSKLQGETHISALVEHFWIVRTSWLFGPRGKNFVRAILEKARLKGLLQVVDDQVGDPTYTMDLAEKLESIVERGRPGIYHVTNSGCCSWFDFAREIIKQAGLSEVKVSPVLTSASDRPAPRPRNSRLANRRLETEGLGLLPPWQDALRRYLLREAALKG